MKDNTAERKNIQEEKLMAKTKNIKMCFVSSSGGHYEQLRNLPFCFWAKVFRKKFIFIETFARVTDASKPGKMMYKYADLFIVQWKSMLDVYPNAVYGGSIY